MTISLNDVTNFFNKLQSYTVNNDGILNQQEAETSYNDMLQNGDYIPDDIRTKFANGGLNTDAFNQIDPLGVKDGFINDQELYKFVSGDSGFTPYKGPQSFPAGALEKAGYAKYTDHCKHTLDTQATAQNAITDIQGILGSASDGSGQLTKSQVDEAITLVQSHTGTVSNYEGKLELLKDMSNHFADRYDNLDGNAEGGVITANTLAREIRYERLKAGEQAT